MQFPVMATNNIIPKTMAHIVFCSQGNSYGRVGEGNKHSRPYFLFAVTMPGISGYLAEVDFYNALICSVNRSSNGGREKAYYSAVFPNYEYNEIVEQFTIRRVSYRYLTTCLEVDEAANLCLHILKPNALSTQFLIQDKLFLCSCLRHERPKIYPPFRERTSSIRLGEECLTSRLVMNLQSSFLCCRLFFLISGCKFEVIFFAWYCLTDNDNKFK
uniref:Uncharacterized protein n=1 Tax=Glossina palpalis gambiensis TaxID=67801 RepID=A0A1B0AZD7_9MUSC